MAGYNLFSWMLGLVFITTGIGAYFFLLNALIVFIVSATLFSSVLMILLAKFMVTPPWLYVGNHSTKTFGKVTGSAVTWYQGKTTNPHVDYGLHFDDVHIPLKGEDFLQGWHVHSPLDKQDTIEARTCVVFVHGGARDRRAFMRHVPIFHARGYGALLFDCRAHGISSGHGLGIGWASIKREALDVATATRYAREHLGYDRIILIGTSQGAAASLISASQLDNELVAVVAENPYMCRRILMRETLTQILGTRTFGLSLWYTLLTRLVIRRVHGILELEHGHVNPIDVIPKLTMPIMLLHGTEDRLIGAHHSEQLYEAMSQHNDNDKKQLWILEGAAHTALYDHAPDEWEDKVLSFLQKWNHA